MRPIITTFGKFSVYSFGVMLATGVIVAVLFSRRRARLAGLKEDRLLDLIIVVMLVSLLGARLVFMLLNGPNAGSGLLPGHGGLSFFGGLALGVAALAILARRWRVPVIDLTDALAPGMALGEAVTRLGCDIFGKPSGAWWGVLHQGVRVHPVQFYSFVLNFALFLFLYTYRPARTGQVTGLYLAGLGVSRFVLEFFREGPGIWAGTWLTWGQAAATLALLAGAALVLFSRRRPASVTGEPFHWVDLTPLTFAPLFFLLR